MWHYERREHGGFRIVITDQAALAAHVGERRFADILRGLIWFDRLVTALALFDRSRAVAPADEAAPAAGRDMDTAFWLVCGALRGCAEAIDSLERGGVRRALSGGGLAAWDELERRSKAWQSGRHVALRNEAAFHVDPDAVARGMARRREVQQQVLFSETVDHSGATTWYPLAQEVLILAQFPSGFDPPDAEAEVQAVVRDANEVGPLHQKVLLGLAPPPTPIG